MPRPETIQGRFKLWRQETERSLREVREAVNAHLPEDRRVSVATVSNYETTTMSPPRSDFVAALKAAHPDLNVTWLLTGDEAMTETEHRHQQAEKAATEGADLRDDVLDQIRAGLGPGADAIIPEPIPPYTVTEGQPPPPERPPSGGGIRRALATHLWKRLMGTQRGQEAWLDGTLGTRIGEALAGPFAALDVEPADLPGDALTDYLQAMTAALRAVCPEPSEPSPSIRQED